MENQIVVFEIGEEAYGVNIASVESIIKMQDITVMPHAPAFVEGVTNLRGKVLAVIDLRKRFGLPGIEATRSSRIIVVTLPRTYQQVGVIVDSVSEVLTVPDSAVEPAPPMTTTVDSAFITGIAKLGQRLVILLDLEKVLSSEEQERLNAVKL